MLPFDDRDGWIWLNGAFVPWREAKMHVLNHGLHYASSVFEGERAYGGTIFKSREHAERLHQSAKLLGFNIPYDVQTILAVKEELLARNKLVDAYIRPVAWRGSEMMAISSQKSSVNLAVAAWEWPNLFKLDGVETGLRLAISEWARPAPNTAPTASKAAGLYMICTLSKHAAEAAGFHDAMMLDWRGYIAEATGANIFLVMDGEIHTPTPDCFLDGITRRTVMELARNRGYKVTERHIKPEELANTQEVFLTGTAAEVKPVSAIAEHHFQIGPVATGLAEDYHALVRKVG